MNAIAYIDKLLKGSSALADHELAHNWARLDATRPHY